jgi:hypothetical protein
MQQGTAPIALLVRLAPKVGERARLQLLLVLVAARKLHRLLVDGTAGGEPVLFSRERLAEIRQRMGPYTCGRTRPGVSR